MVMMMAVVLVTVVVVVVAAGAVVAVVVEVVVEVVVVVAAVVDRRGVVWAMPQVRSTSLTSIPTLRLRRRLPYLQVEHYNEFIPTLKKHYARDWVGVFDLDEFAYAHERSSSNTTAPPPTLSEVVRDVYDPSEVFVRSYLGSELRVTF